MIDPQHDCSWTSRRKTELMFCIEDRKCMLWSSGVSARVLLSSVADVLPIWFSNSEACDNSGGDVACVGFAGISKIKPVNFADHQPGFVTTAIGDLCPVSEYRVGVIGSSTQQRDGVPRRFKKAVANLVYGAQFVLHIHDDCFATCIFRSKATLERVVRQVLRLHAFYLNQNFDTQDVIGGVLEFLNSGNELRLRSRPRSWRNRMAQIEMHSRENRRAKWNPTGSIELESLTARLKSS